MRVITAPAEVAALVAAEQVEEARITIWALIDPTVRRLALAIAEVPDDRAHDDLTTFSRIERARISNALQSMMTKLSVAEQCMRDTTRNTTVLH
ncbi:hypothetical protein [Janthinobacterium sp.]|uniref:hypothetical protein n=1 Tax=Janthinobacterium sp. TaxID=1871054 RepID=UPI0026342101|nr:hypothetical protein [Janthinobacterium sp.]